MNWTDFVSVAPRYTRSINLERDAVDAASIEGYVLTSTGLTFLDRIAAGVSDPTAQRAWTLTGPYGAGKSAFALYLASLLGPATESSPKRARLMLKEQAPEAYSLLFDRGSSARINRSGFCSVLVTGTPEPILGSLLKAVCRDLRPFYAGPGRLPASLRKIEALRDAFDAGRNVSPREFVGALMDSAKQLRESGRAQGIVLAIDELGKFLEYAARSPERGDIYVLQQLAEACTKLEPATLLVITVLHQSFERYASELRPNVRDEWAKVQGRFEDVAFQEPPEQQICLLSSAIEHTRHPATKRLEQSARDQGKRAVELGLLPRGMSAREFLQAVENCAPLHPLTALVLPRLCRKFGQNQRSLFSFLVSREAFGFGEFLLSEVKAENIRLYTLADLYDYVAGAFGNGLSIGEGATRWAEVQATLERMTAATPDELRLVKTVGLLSAIGIFGELKPSQDIVRFALGDPQSFARTLKSLRSSSALIERKHNGTIALWEGSDIDLDARVREASGRVLETADLAEKLSNLWTPRPLVAKRHSYKYGTLRYFSVVFAGATSLNKQRELRGAEDGLIVYGIPNNSAEYEDLIHLAENSDARDQLQILIAIPRNVEPLKEAIRELELLKWVQLNTPELHSDTVARRELRSRISVAEARLASELRQLFSPGESSSQSTAWFHHGHRQNIGNPRTLANFLSDICDDVYGSTPVLRNELINRRALSTAAAKARRNLLEAMVKRSAEPRLGFEGTPPEVSIYCSVLEDTGIHRADESGFGFFSPPQNSVTSVWEGIESFFESCESEKKSVAALFGMLQRPPFGMKVGVIPILVCAAALAHDIDIAFYENNAFVPELTIEVIERLLKSPERFSIRRYKIEGVRREVFRQMAKLFGGATATDTQDIVAIMKPLYRFLNRLPAYSRQSRNLSDPALALRSALLAAKEPDVLLFHDLPLACGVEPFTSTAAIKPELLSQFLRTLKGALAELQRAYDEMLTTLSGLLFKAFHIDDLNARMILRNRASVLRDHCVEPRLKAFIYHLSDEEASDTQWIEAIATLLIGKVPQSWNDSDRIRFEVNLTDIVRSFRHLDAVVFEQTKRIANGTSADQVLRIGISDRHSKDVEAVVVVERKDRDRLAEAILEIRNGLDKLSLGGNPELALAALGMVSRQLLLDFSETTTVERRELKGVPHG